MTNIKEEPSKILVTDFSLSREDLDLIGSRGKRPIVELPERRGSYIPIKAEDPLAVATSIARNHDDLLS